MFLYEKFWKISQGENISKSLPFGKQGKRNETKNERNERQSTFPQFNTQPHFQPQKNSQNERKTHPEKFEKCSFLLVFVFWKETNWTTIWKFPIFRATKLGLEEPGWLVFFIREVERWDSWVVYLLSSWLDVFVSVTLYNCHKKVLKRNWQRSTITWPCHNLRIYRQQHEFMLYIL